MADLSRFGAHDLCIPLFFFFFFFAKVVYYRMNQRHPQSRHTQSGRNPDVHRVRWHFFDSAAGMG